MKITQYSMLSSFRTVPVFGQIVFKAYFLRVAIATNLIIWDSDDSPSFNELLLCTFVRFVLFVTKQEIFEKCESNWFLSKSTSFTETENIHHCCGSQCSKTSSQNYVVFASKKPQKAFLSSGNFSHHFSKPSRRNDLSKF